VKELAKRIFFWGSVGGAIVVAVRAKGTSSSVACGENRAHETSCTDSERLHQPLKTPASHLRFLALGDGRAVSIGHSYHYG
jgi:hypothetical protein